MMYLLVIYLAVVFQVSALTLFRRGPLENDHTYAQSTILQALDFKDCFKTISSDPSVPVLAFLESPPISDELGNPVQSPTEANDECQASVIKCLENFLHRLFPLSVLGNGDESQNYVQNAPSCYGHFYSASTPIIRTDDFEHSLNLDEISDFDHEPLDFDSEENDAFYDHSISSRIGTVTDPSIDKSNSESCSTEDITEEDKVLSDTHLRTLYDHLFDQNDLHGFDSYISDFENSN